MLSILIPSICPTNVLPALPAQFFGRLFSFSEGFKVPFPVIAFHRNVVFTRRGEAFALYRLAPQPYHYLPEEHRRAVVSRFEELLFGLEGRGQILLLWEEKDLDEGAYLAAAGADGANPPWRSAEAARHARAARAAVSGGARVRRRYLVVELRSRDATKVSGLRDLLSLASDLALEYFGLAAGGSVPPRRVRAAMAAEAELYRRLRAYGLSRAEFADLDFIFRRTARRVGVLGPPLPSREGGALTPGMLAAFSEGAFLEEKINCVVVRDGLGRSHVQVFVTFADVPKRLSELGDEFLGSTDFFGDPADVVVHFEVVPPHRAIGKVRSKRLFLKGQMKEALQGGDEPTELEQLGLHDSRLLEAKVESGQPLARVSFCFAVAAPTEGEAQAAATRLLQKFSSKGFRAVRPAGLQLKCLYSFLPGAPPGAPMVECDPGYIAAAGPMASCELGDPHGFLLGWQGAVPVFWKPGRPATELNKTNAVLVTGSLGGGKSMTVKTLVYFAVLAGGVAFVIDPKDEYRVFGKLFPTDVIDFSPRGGVKLNPFALSADPQRAKSVALDYLCLALNAGNNEARRVALAQAVEMVASLPPEKRHLGYCLAALRKLAAESQQRAVREEAGQCALLLEYLRTSDVGSMAFGEGTSGAGPLSGGEVIRVVNLKELPLPRRGADPSRITESERQGLALMYLAAAMAREVAFGLPRGLLKCLVFDEAWALFAVPEGQRLLEEVVRIGRTFNLIPVLISQNAGDFATSKVVVNNVSNVFCFQANDEDEVAANLQFLGAGAGELNVNFFRNLVSGSAVFRDAEGRIGLLHVDPQPPYLLELFDTRPREEREKAAAAGGR